LTRWAWTLAALLGSPWPPPRKLPGRVHRIEDDPPTAEELAAITSCAELAALLGISRQAAHQRINRRRPGASNESPT